MAGQVKRMIDSIIERRSKGNSVLKSTTLTKLLLKGIDAEKYAETSLDDPEVIRAVRLAASELGVSLVGTRTAYSSDTSVDGVVADLCSQFENNSPKAVIYFASAAYDQNALARATKSHFAGAKVFGCSTAGELVSGKMLKQSVVAMAIGADVLDDINVQVVTDVKSMDQITGAVKGFETYYGTSLPDMDTASYVGIVLVDGVSGGEEMLMDTLGNLSDITFIGGSAGDDLQFKATYVHTAGAAYSGAAVLALLKVKNGFDTIKTQSFRSLGHKLVATAVDETRREVVEFNGVPALDAYANALGLAKDEAHTHFMRNPVGLMVGSEPYVRSPQRANGDTMVFYCNIKKGMELELLESTDIVSDTKAALDPKLSDARGVAGIIDFDCILRTLELENEGQSEAYASIFASVPTIGFSTYGEEYIGHINQTSTMLLLM